MLLERETKSFSSPLFIPYLGKWLGNPEAEVESNIGTCKQVIFLNRRNWKENNNQNTGKYQIHLK